MRNETDMLKSLLELVVELNQVHDLDILMERILERARHFSGADAGSIYIREGDHLKFSYTQNRTLESRLAPGRKLVYTTFSMPVDDTSIAGYVAESGEFLNIADVYELPDTLPYRFNKEMDNLSDYRTSSMLTLPLITPTDGSMGVLQVINALDGEGRTIPFSDEDEQLMFHFAALAAVALARAQITRAAILRLVEASALRDPKETGAHVNRVAGYSITLYEHWARRHGVSEGEIATNRDVFRMAAMLHDVGKIAISDNILKKPGKLDPDEYEQMKTHTFIGANLFRPFDSAYNRAAAEVALCHHERWDGRGYPGRMDLMKGLPVEAQEPRSPSGEMIPIFGRIVALADVFDALSSKRAYKDEWKEKDVLDYIREARGGQFDPELVDIFFEVLDELRRIQALYSIAEENRA
ncbi:phosphohydrolase [Desulfoluna limicola]|uniref:Phosphohydrolase n=1 Tax=Desulfoluna limicola TaxID=2810562 RepID=A0ABN6EXJ6_9BACT|nr:HD domain-containing phosphohydrolase [Desulfoluna limicola]BCS95067.1 phosphohydrolase [Desulfoluna limicola]